MQPKSVKAPTPPPGAGGLNGVYWHTALNQVTSVNGFPISTQGIEPVYFRPDGYYYIGVYRWGYDALDCSRVSKEGKPMCGTYAAGNGSIQMDREKKTLQKKPDGGLVIGGDRYTYVKPAINQRMEGRFESYSATTTAVGMPNVASAQSTEYTFHRDGTFEDSRTSGVSAPVPGASQSRSSKISGTYSLNGYTMEFRYNEGRTRRYVCWLNTPDSLFLDGTLFVQPK